MSQNPHQHPGYDPYGAAQQQAAYRAAQQQQQGRFGYGTPHVPQHSGVQLNAHQREFFTKTFGWMSMGLGLTAVVAYMTYATGLWRAVLGIHWILFIAEIGLVFFLAARVHAMKPATAIATFLGYAALNGLTLSVIFIAYQLGTIFMTFGVTTAMFGFMFVWGLATKKDLSGMGSILFMALIGLIIATVVNMLATSFGWFPAGMNTAMAWIINYAGVVIFAGLTMWDAQKLKQLSAGGFYNADMATRASISGALMLYLDFINLFIFLLNILGGRRN